MQILTPWAWTPLVPIIPVLSWLYLKIGDKDRYGSGLGGLEKEPNRTTRDRLHHILFSPETIVKQHWSTSPLLKSTSVVQDIQQSDHRSPSNC